MYKMSTRYWCSLTTDWLRTDRRLIKTKVKIGWDVSNLDTFAHLCSLVAKPDQLIKRRAKQGLVLLNKDLNDVKGWIADKLGKEVEVEGVKGRLNKFIVEPYVPHDPKDEYYICVYTARENDVIMFHREGGVDVGNIDEKANKLSVNLDADVNKEDIKDKLLKGVPSEKEEMLLTFIELLYKVFRSECLTYLELNPLVVTNKIYLVDTALVLDVLAFAGKLQASGKSIDKSKLSFTTPFGRDLLPEEARAAKLDQQGPGEFKLTLLNPKGRVWMMAGGGASSLFMCDAVCDMLGEEQLANYGQFSGKPVAGERGEFAKLIIDLMTKEKVEGGKMFYIASTVGPVGSGKGSSDVFTAVVDVLKENKDRLKEYDVKIAVQQGVVSKDTERKEAILKLEKFLGIPIYAYGPEKTGKDILSEVFKIDPATVSKRTSKNVENGHLDKEYSADGQKDWKPVKTLFTKDTKAFLAGVPPPVVQDSLDVDFLGSRTTPSVAALIHPDSEESESKFRWGEGVISIPTYKRIDEALKNHSDVDVLALFAPPPLAFKATMFALKHPQIKTIILNVGGLSDLQSRQVLSLAKQKDVTIIGPGSLKHPMQVGGIKPGCFQFGRMGGNADNVLACKLYRQGSVALVSRTGGLSNMVIHAVNHHTDGIYEAIAIGGGSYTGTSMVGHVLGYQDNPDVKLIVVIGEIGTTEEQDVVMAMKKGLITKPVVAYCVGTCASAFKQQPVQFGHGGLTAVGAVETATVKNKAFKDAGAIVPDCYDDIGKSLSAVYQELVRKGTIVPKPEASPPSLPAKQ
ncbi:ATP-citrate synthase-like isoform X2 [Ptychodera flava]|uniref:ATP-citrate synthase-like isoform X2 n=1 Tax=Ptychodera flava TaxID=63121 RepID=UPI003969D5C5